MVQRTTLVCLYLYRLSLDQYMKWKLSNGAFFWEGFSLMMIMWIKGFSLKFEALIFAQRKRKNTLRV